MIEKNDSLTILHDDNSSFTEYSHKMAQFGNDSVTLTITSAEDYIYVGYKKPIDSFYVNITTQDGSEGELSLDYWNGSAWTSATSLSDNSYGLYRSGFIRWDRELDNQTKNTVNNSEKYWYRITLNQDRTAIVVKGLNLIFSDDYELTLEQPYILNTDFLGDESSHIKTHAAVKREVIQKFRNKNYIKYNSITGEKEDINAWDLLDIEEVKLASTYLALSKIYNQLSDDPQDIWFVKARMYEQKFNKYIDLARLSVDTDDDGLVSMDENKPAFTNRYMRR